MKRPGMTILELLIYMAIATASVLVFMNFMVNVTHISARTKAMKEIDQQARYVMGRMVQDIRGATVVALNVDTLTITAPNGDTVAYKYSSPTVQYQLNATGWTALTSPSVNVTALTFTSAPPSQLWKITMAVETPAGAPPSAHKELTLESTVQPHNSLY
jgi:hypothetical protein